jgi:hypothetical protein
MPDLTISQVLAVLLVLFVAWMALACWWTGRDRKRSSLRCPGPVPRDGEPLTEDEQKVFNGYVVAEQRGYPLADEPQSRRQP